MTVSFTAGWGQFHTRIADSRAIARSRAHCYFLPVTGQIRILEDGLVDQIAAGEVVERPASVVKELLENAVDAGASNISVEIADGGISLIRVADDGFGMAEQDAPLSLQRHATSKLRSFEQLGSISTLGFRGEALPSIASVSRLTLTSRTRGQVAGSRLGGEGGKRVESGPVGCAPGTAVEVRDLFYNVPARRKFLKSRGTESSHISTACLRAVLAFPALRLKLVRDGKRATQYLPADGFAERTAAIFPEEKLVRIESERDGVRVTAALVAPERARSSSAHLHLFVNNRPVRDPSLARAVLYAYGSVLPPGRHPLGGVHLQLDPSRVDVNVHPQKLEIRIADAHGVLDTVTRLLARGLGTAAWSGPASRGAAYWSRRLGVRGSGTAGNASLQPKASPGPAAAVPESGTAKADDPWGLVGRAEENGPAPQTLSTSPERLRAGEAATASLLPEAGFFGSLRVLGQVRKLFLICEGEDALYIVDQHAADERVKYDALRRGYAQGRICVQRLLFPERVELSEQEMTLAREHLADLRAAALDCDPVGPATIAVRSAPALLGRASPERLLRDLLTELGRDGQRAFADSVDRALATMACHGAIRAGDPLSLQEAQALLSSLDRVTDFAGHCPHGRPVVHRIALDDIELQVSRTKGSR